MSHVCFRANTHQQSSSTLSFSLCCDRCHAGSQHLSWPGHILCCALMATTFIRMGTKAFLASASGSHLSPLGRIFHSAFFCQSTMSGGFLEPQEFIADHRCDTPPIRPSGLPERFQAHVWWLWGNDVSMLDGSSDVPLNTIHGIARSFPTREPLLVSMSFTGTSLACRLTHI